MVTGEERSRVATTSMALGLVVALAGLGACAQPAPETAPPATRPAPGPALGLVASVDSRLVPNLRRVSAGVYSSGRPEGVPGFRAVAALGVRTVVSVDGERPDVASARSAGLRSVHLPFGYAGVPAERAREIAKLVHELPGPILFHCHHGTQRGPAGAAIACRALGEETAEEALAAMRAAGLDPRYKGLAATVAAFVPPTPGDLAAVPARFPEVTPPPPFVEVMLELDARLERLEKNRPLEGDAAHEALLVWEGLTELRRRPTDRGAAFLERLDAAVAAAHELEAAAHASAPAPALARVRKTCLACHERYRDNS